MAPGCQGAFNWAIYMLALPHSTQWYYNSVVWTDICNSILPRTEAKAKEQALARKSKKGWISPGCQEFSRNLRGKSEAIKQSSWDTERIWWATFLVRGKLHVQGPGFHPYCHFFNLLNFFKNKGNSVNKKLINFSFTESLD